MIPYTFKGIQPGDTVRYKTPQGQVFSGRANPLLLFGFHVVVDRGNGRPIVVNANNYVSHRGKHDRAV